MGDGIETTKGAQVKAPYGDGVSDSTPLRVTVGAASVRLKLPDGWQNGFVSAKADGIDACLLFSKNPNASVAVPSAAADGNPSPTNGWLLREGDGREDYWVPQIQAPDSNYVYAISVSGSGSLWLYKSSE